MGISELKESGGEKFSVKELERTKRGLESRLEKLRADDKKDDVVTFEELGVDRMFVDEAHNYKNLFRIRIYECIACHYCTKFGITIN